jgi:hypothetical protein
MTDTQQFKLLAADGTIIAQGAAALETLPDTKARAAALENMLKVAADAAEAEQTLEKAHASAVRMITDSVARLSHRLDAYLARREAQQRRDEEEAELKEQEELQEYLDSLPDPDNPEHHNSLDLAVETPATDQDPEGVIPEPKDPEGAVLDQLQGLVETRPVVDPAELSHPETPAQRNPVAISLMEE